MLPQNMSTAPLENGGAASMSAATVAAADTGSSETATWLKYAQDAYDRSTGYFDANYRKRWEDDLRMFQSKHPRDSKYMADAYKYRSRIFRPKSRSVVRKNEATAALAFFSNPDAVSIDPVNEDDPRQVASAEVMQALLNYRLTKTIPWFLTVIGGFQDALNVGLVCSMQYWDYQAERTKRTETVEMPGFGMVEVDMEDVKVIKDQPCVHLIPIENIRFDPAAHWYDVVGTSPYLIVQMPMYINDVLDRMDTEGSSYAGAPGAPGGAKWKKLDKQTLMNARVEGLDPLRQARNDNREPADAVQSDVNEFDVVMVHLNFVKVGHVTHAYYTLKDEHLLSKPMPVEEMFLHCKDGKPPVRIGFTVLETHKSVPSSLIGLTSDLQRETNEIANQRLDNVKFVLNKRQLVRRGANVDVDSLLRNVPGGVTMVNDVERDVREVSWPDVTSSSYQEQDRVSVDFDELAGNFAQGSVLTNRKLNETVGGMRMMAQGANMMTEYGIRVYVETWVEPVLRQIMHMESEYETDAVILGVAGQKAPTFIQYGMSEVTDEMLRQELTLSVNVGMGATDPDTRLQRFLQAMGAYQKMALAPTPDVNLKEVRKTLFGLSGFKDSVKYFQDVDPRIEQAKQVAMEAEAKAKEIINNAKDKLFSKEMVITNKMHEIQLMLAKQGNEFGTKMQELQQEFVLAQRDQQMQFMLDMRGQNVEMDLARKKQREQAALDRKKAEDDAAVKRYEARTQALIKEFQAQTDRTVAQMKAKQQISAKKKGDTWEVTKQAQ